MTTTSNPTARTAGQMTLVTGATGAIGSALAAVLWQLWRRAAATTWRLTA